MKKSSASSRRAKPLRAREKSIKNNTRKRDRELQALLRLPDQEIDTSDIPEVTDWSRAMVGKLYRPIKEPVTIRLDADILAWLKSAGPGYQTKINGLLRKAMPSTSALTNKSRS